MLSFFFKLLNINNMKINVPLYLAVVILLFSSRLFSQVTWKDFTVYDSKLDPTKKISDFYFVESADLNKDGLVDVIAASRRENSWRSKLMWFKNRGNLKFSDPIVIFNEEGDALDLFIDVGDIDNDQDIDISFVTSEEDQRVIWFENVNNGSEFLEHPIADMFYEDCAVLNDLDQDGDLDVMTAGTRHTEWYKNIDGKGNFVLQERFYEYFNGSTHKIKGEDYDDDGDPDVLYWRGNNGSFGTDDMYLHLNTDGKGTFGPQMLLSKSDPKEMYDIEFIDLNNDNQKDIVMVCGCDPSGSGGQIFWRAIKNGVIQSEKHVIDSKLRSATYLTRVDLDRDGDFDLIAEAGNRDTIAGGEMLMYFNDGGGNFKAARSAYKDGGWMTSSKAVDLDGDGKLEIVGTNTVGVFGISLSFPSNAIETPDDQNVFTCTPNPTNSIVTISPADVDTDYSISLHNMLGVLLLEDENTKSIDLSTIPSGTYFLVVKEKLSRKLHNHKIVKI
jgi:hypothetical protein